MNYEDFTSELSHKRRSISDLVSYIKMRTNSSHPNYSLFLGAGASVTSGIKTGANLVEGWRKEVYEMLSGDVYKDSKCAKEYLIQNEGSWYSEYNEYSSLFEKKFDLPSQRRRFVEKEVDAAIPSIGYAYLVSLSESNDKYFDTIFTTNFDDLINEAFYQFSMIRPLVCAHDSSVFSLNIASGRPKIVKLHGDYLFDDIKSTLRETESLENNIKQKFVEFSKEYGLIFVGYSGQDRSIMDVLNHLLKHDSYFKNGIYWCIRKGDYISPELRKLLWKERVYYVEVDGFDELMAELHFEIKGDLSIKDNISSSKQDKILRVFSEDRYNLSSSSDIIRSDLEKLKRHKDEFDITRLIMEISNSDKGRIDNISENEFKILLEVESEAKANGVSAALDIAESNLDNVSSEDVKIRLISKIVDLYSREGNSGKAISYCEKLIESDIRNASFHLMKAESYESLSESCQYLKKKINEFKSSASFLNSVSRLAIQEIKNTTGSPVFDVGFVEGIVSDSLRLDPGLSNPAWSIYFEVLTLKHSKTTGKEEIRKRNQEFMSHLDKAEAINKDHVRTIKLAGNPVCLENREINQGDYAISLLEGLSEYNKAKSRVVFSYVCDLLVDMSNLLDFKTPYYGYYKDFINNDAVVALEFKDSCAGYLLLKSLYCLGVEEDFSRYREYLYGMKSCPDFSDYLAPYLNKILKGFNDVDEAESIIKIYASEFDDFELERIKSEILAAQKKYDQSMSHIERYLTKGGSLNSYAVSKSFNLLKCHRFSEVMPFVEHVSNFITDEETKNILQLNGQAAIKSSGGEIEDHKVRSVLSKDLKPIIQLGVYALLEQETDFKRVLKELVRYDAEYSFALKEWVIIPQKFMKYIDELSIGIDKKDAARLTLV